MIRKILTLFLALLLSQSFILAAVKNEDKNMTRTDICKENYKTLFKGEALANTGSDPEMMAILQKYIFYSVFSEIFRKSVLKFSTIRSHVKRTLYFRIFSLNGSAKFSV